MNTLKEAFMLLTGAFLFIVALVVAMCSMAIAMKISYMFTNYINL